MGRQILGVELVDQRSETQETCLVDRESLLLGILERLKALVARLLRLEDIHITRLRLQGHTQHDAFCTD